MSLLLSNTRYNPRDYYLIKNIKTGEIRDDVFRRTDTAHKFKKDWDLDDDWKVIVNPKYKNDTN